MRSASISISPFVDAKPGELYQLVSQGALERRVDAPRETYLRCYFRATDWQQSSEKPFGDYIMRRINLHQASSMKVGSLWQSDGELAASSKMRLQHTKKFTLEPGILAPQPLSKILPELDNKAPAPLVDFLSKELLVSIKNTPFVRVAYRSTSILISCFELARSFYFWAGPRIVDFFFYPGKITDICREIMRPFRKNRWAAKLLIHCQNNGPALHDLPRHFTQEQVAILAELLFNPSFNRSFTDLRSKLLSRWRESPIAHLWLNLVLEKAVQVQANGITFTHNDHSYFWVTSLIERGNYFSFNSLKYTSLEDHRQGRNQTPANWSAELDRLRAHIDWHGHSSPMPNSDYAGSSLYGTPDVAVPTDEEVALPRIERTAKVLQQEVSKATYQHIYGKPTILSERGGGHDLNSAKVFFHLEIDKVTYSWYFQAMVKEFQRFSSVKCLEINNESKIFGSGVCILLSKDGLPYRVATAEILYNDRYFYFIQVLASRSKRWAFFFKMNNKAPFSPHQIEYILRAIYAAHDDWVIAKKKYEERLSRSFLDNITIIPHNRKGIFSDVQRCRNNMRAQFRSRLS